MSSLFRYKLKPGEIEQIAKIYQAGYSIMAINRVYGFSFRSRTIENGLRKIGIEIRQGKRKIPLSQEETIVREYQSGVSSYELAKKYRVHFSAICELLERNGTKRRDNRILNDEEEQRLIKEYQAGKSTQALNKLFGTTNAHRVIKRHQIQTRKPGHNSRIYQLNELLFDDLGDEISSYVLGFIYADGSINKETLHIGLSVKDVCHLEMIRDTFGQEIPIKHYLVKTPQGKNKEAVRLSVHSQKITRRLTNLGIVKGRGKFNESITPNLPEAAYRHFIRGIVDGDGSIDAPRRNNARLRILGQRDMLNWIANIFHLALNIPYREPRQRLGIMELEYGGALQARTIINWLYQDANIFLKRKKEIADKTKRG